MISPDCDPIARWSGFEEAGNGDPGSLLARKTVLNLVGQDLPLVLVVFGVPLIIAGPRGSAE